MDLDALVDDIWNIYDTNGDGTLQGKEYKNFVRDLCAKGTDFEG